jgi:putative endonuclease
MNTNLQRRKLIGKAGETAAQNYIETQGYSICDLNFRPKIDGVRLRGEIDIVALDGNTLCFVEVKTRLKRLSSPEESVDGRKRTQLVKLAEAYLFERKISAETQCRFDVVSVIMTPSLSPVEIVLIRDAFSPE